MSKSQDSHYLVTWHSEMHDSKELAVITATSRKTAAAQILNNTDAYGHSYEVEVYTLPAHNPNPTTFKCETVTETRIVEVTD